MIKDHAKKSKSYVNQLFGYVNQLFGFDEAKEIDEFVRTEVEVKLIKTDWLL